MIEIPDLAVAGLAAGTVSALVLGGGLLRSLRHRTRHRAEIAGLRSRLDEARQETERVTTAVAAEIAHLAAARIPAEATRAAHPHVRVPGPLHPGTLGGRATADAESPDGRPPHPDPPHPDPPHPGPPAAERPAAGPPPADIEAALGDVLTAVLAATARERKRVDAAARAGMRGATRDIQAGLYRLQDVLRGLQQRYDEPELAQTLFALDHENEQSLRRAQVTAVVCGAWVGLAREESHLVEAVTGGQSRLVGYHRVRVNNHLEPGTALVSHAVEPVAIIVAELLDNALRHSAPDTAVVVNLETVHHGVSVTVDDSGVGMAADERAYAQKMVAGTDPILLSDLGDPPRMGLAAIGQLTRRFDLSVDLSSPSPYGGVRAVLLVRKHLLSHIDPVEQPPAASTPRSTRPAVADDGAPDPAHARAGSPADTEPGAVSASAAVRETAAGHQRAAETDAGPETGPGRKTGPGADSGTGADDTAAEVLPQRRRKARAAHGRAAANGTAAAPAAPARTPEEAAAALGALQAGTAAARNAVDTEGNDPR
ncbi:ATP-binding protein [Streptomyces sp. NPDC093221]|uniref:ATP-binding protein n=1 Tax=Streptomyces sp. NPDC093221 TaxID=3366032 RepID=UPI00380123DC